MLPCETGIHFFPWTQQRGTVYKPPMSHPTGTERTALIHHLMRRQLRLSLQCAIAFLILLLGLPLANYFAPEFMAQSVFGFTLSWFVVGIAFFPFVWVISYYFIRRSLALEADEVAARKNILS